MTRTRKTKTTRRPTGAKLTRASLSRMSDETLLKQRIGDLPLKIDNTWVQRCINKLYQELDRKGLDQHYPHCWLSTEWFSPDGVPGIAVPFYLVHPRLHALERSKMFEVEGGTVASCMRILRHEAGHCIDTAYQLHRTKAWREQFGRYSTPYPDSYKPRPKSKKFVLHLGGFYAQAHPAEDFAETFAVWLTPKSGWRQTYEGWPAMRKLEYVDQTMKEIAGVKPAVRSRKHIESFRETRMTLGEFYEQRQQRFADDFPDFFDNDLYKLFSDQPRYANNRTAASFLRDVRPELRSMVAKWTSAHAYAIDQVLGDMVERCKTLRLRLTMSEKASFHQATVMLTVQTMNFVQSNPFRLSM